MLPCIISYAIEGFPSIISKICNENNLDQFIHISALGIDQAKDSKYAKSKLDGEQKIKENFDSLMEKITKEIKRKWL